MEITRTTFDAIGTRWDMRVLEPLADHEWSELQVEIGERIEQFDRAYSRFRPDSLVSRIAATAGTFELPADGLHMLDFYKQLYQATDGKVTPLIGQAMSDAGYDADYSFEPKSIEQPPSWEEVLSYDATSITVQKPVLLDFGAAGKGYLVDIISGLLEKGGVTSFVINAGGDIMHRAPADETVEVGLENPLDTTEAIGLVRLGNASLCASSGSKRKWQGFHHIIDPAALRSPENILASWVVASDTMTADGLATALFFQSGRELQDYYRFSYAVLTRDMQLEYSKDFPVTVFKAK